MRRIAQVNSTFSDAPYWSIARHSKLGKRPIVSDAKVQRIDLAKSKSCLALLFSGMKPERERVYLNGTTSEFASPG
jgi:hypothetical protein